MAAAEWSLSSGPDTVDCRPHSGSAFLQWQPRGAQRSLPIPGSLLPAPSQMHWPASAQVCPQRVPLLPAHPVLRAPDSVCQRSHRARCRHLRRTRRGSGQACKAPGWPRLRAQSQGVGCCCLPVSKDGCLPAALCRCSRGAPQGPLRLQHAAEIWSCRSSGVLTRPAQCRGWEVYQQSEAPTGATLGPAAQEIGQPS